MLVIELRDLPQTSRLTDADHGVVKFPRYLYTGKRRQAKNVTKWRTYRFGHKPQRRSVVKASADCMHVCTKKRMLKILASNSSVCDGQLLFIAKRNSIARV